MYYIYALFDPVNRLPFYIGKGKGDRAYHHIEGKDTQNIKKCRTIKNLLSLGVEPEVHFIAENIQDERLAYSLEFFMIRNAAAYGISLTNRIGVDLRPPCRKGTKMSAESKDKISRALRGKKKSVVMTDEHKQKISESLKGRTPKRALHIDETKLRELYLDEGLTRKQIAKLYGVSAYPINRLLKAYKISKL
jgi:hypothetical protein